MSFLGFGKKMFKTAVQVVVTPVEVAKDIVTFGGMATDQDEPYTVQRAKKIAEDFEDGLDELDE